MDWLLNSYPMPFAKVDLKDLFPKSKNQEQIESYRFYEEDFIRWYNTVFDLVPKIGLSTMEEITIKDHLTRFKNLNIPLFKQYELIEHQWMVLRGNIESILYGKYPEFKKRVGFYFKELTIFNSIETLEGSVKEKIKFIERLLNELEINDLKAGREEGNSIQQKLLKGLKKRLEFEEKEHLEKEKLSFAAQKLNEDLKEDNSRTKELIIQQFKSMDVKGWNYAFFNEESYKTFIEILTAFFEQRAYNIPASNIRLRSSCRTKLAKTLGSIYKELSEDPLKSNTEYFKIIQVLSHFSKMVETDLYKALTR
ncbi:MAG: hypothetical protein GY810_05205 [Aureispira sp.]|nr:hypothetical protein [Aureispira sp.]